MLKFEGRSNGKVVVELPDEVDKSKEGFSIFEGQRMRTTTFGEVLTISREDIFHTYQQGRLECPSFDGSDFSGWLMKAEQYFEA